MVKLLAEFDIFALWKHKGSTVDYKAQRTRTRSTTFNKNDRLTNERQISFWNRKMTERWRAGDNRLEAGYREPKLIRKDAVKMVANGTTGLLLMKAKKCKSRRWKEATRSQRKNVWRRNIISAVIRRRDNAPSALWFVPLTKRGNLSAKDVIGGCKKKCAGQEKFLLTQERVPRAETHRLEPGEKAQF